MIGVKTPFRVSLLGGGSDVRDFYRYQTGAVVSFSIARYMYIFVHPFFEKKIQLKYSKTELVNSIAEIEHPIVREVLRRFSIHNIDINSIADIPAGTGLGSSSSFTVSLLHALYAYSGQYVSKDQLAREACEIEVDVLGEPIGKQDQYAAAFGGLNFISFYPDESVSVEPIILTEAKRIFLEENLLMYYLGSVRSARQILTDQKLNLQNVQGKRENLRKMTALAAQLRRVLINGEFDDIGPLLDEGWQHKKQMSTKISNPAIDSWYERALDAGATGGKLLGAGGGGFMLLYCPPERQDQVRSELADWHEMPWKFEGVGTTVIYVGDERVGHEPWASEVNKVIPEISWVGKRL